MLPIPGWDSADGAGIKVRDVECFSPFGPGQGWGKNPMFSQFFQHDFTTQTCRDGDFGRSAMNFFEFEEAVVVVVRSDHWKDPGILLADHIDHL